MFNLDKVELEFSDESLDAIARKAIDRKTGARGLRAIAETILLEAMYVIPTQKNIKSMLVTAETLENNQLETQYLSSVELEEKEKKNQISLLDNKEAKES